MGKYHATVTQALHMLRELNAEDPDFARKKQEAFKAVATTIDSHISEELVEQMDVDNLINALVNYRKHLIFAKHILEGTETELNEVDVDLLKKIHKGNLMPYNSHLFVQKQLELALKEYKYVKDNLVRILDQEKIRLK